MAQLITMRQRIKAVETIKKITHAMRLISMSTHSRLRRQKEQLEYYKDTIQSLWLRLQDSAVTPSLKEGEQKHLIIVASSQKGLCGTFNSTLFKYFESQHKSMESHYDIIAVGKQAIEYFANKDQQVLASYDNFTATHFVSIAQAIVDLATASPVSYKEIVLYSNYQKNFFVQSPHKNVIFPLTQPQGVPAEEPIDYLFEQSFEELTHTMRQLMLTVTLQELLFDSLLAEHAARFLSMDSSTRNADNLLVSMKLEYNKARQAAITRELTELSTNY